MHHPTVYADLTWSAFSEKIYSEGKRLLDNLNIDSLGSARSTGPPIHAELVALSDIVLGRENTPFQDPGHILPLLGGSGPQ
jgi:hypothetical protein